MVPSVFLGKGLTAVSTEIQNTSFEDKFYLVLSFLLKTPVTLW